MDTDKIDRQKIGELSSICNTCYSRANKNSYYNKQQQYFERNIHDYATSAKNAHIHKHVIEITHIFKNHSKTHPR